MYGTSRYIYRLVPLIPLSHRLQASGARSRHGPTVWYTYQTVERWRAAIHLLPTPRLVKRDITNFLDGFRFRVFSASEIISIFDRKRRHWRIPEDVRAKQFIEFLLEKTKLRQVTLKSPYGKRIVRYIWGHPSPYQLGLCIRRDAYLSHGSAVFLHGLTDQVPARIYVNQEQRPKFGNRGGLTQKAVDLAFSRPQRQSSYIIRQEQWRIVLISGKHTGQLEIGKILGPSGEELKVTKLERTLIDITVRPAYAGGSRRVLEAFKAAKDKVRIDVLISTLEELDYLYPYHQAIGFYMDRTGYDAICLEKIRSLGLDMDFYLAHGIRDLKYESRWRLYYPRKL